MSAAMNEKQKLEFMRKILVELVEFAEPYAGDTATPSFYWAKAVLDPEKYRKDHPVVEEVLRANGFIE